MYLGAIKIITPRVTNGWDSSGAPVPDSGILIGILFKFGGQRAFNESNSLSLRVVGDWRLISDGIRELI